MRRRDFCLTTGGAAAMLVSGSRQGLADETPLIREDRSTTTPDGFRLALRAIYPRALGEAAGLPLLLLHGARVPALASFDLPVPGGSLAADLAMGLGCTVYLLDLRGYGGSDRPPEMELRPAESPPLVRTADAIRDLACAVSAITRWSGRSQVALLGWATGGHWCAAYAAQAPDSVSRLVLYNTLYGGGGENHPTLGRGSWLDDPAASGTLNVAALGGYRLNTAASLFPGWDASIPVEDKTLWRDPVLAEAYAAAALASDPSSDRRHPPSFRAPSGALADSYELALGRKQWQASALAMPTLVLRCGLDFWSRPEDAEAIAAEAPRAELVVLPDATHFVHLERPETGRTAFLAPVTGFLAS